MFGNSSPMVDNGRLIPRWETCDPRGMGGMKRLTDAIMEVEDFLRKEARGTDDFGYMVIKVDKARQTPLNAMQGRDGGGEAAMQAYLDLVRKAVAKIAGSGDGLHSISLFRVSKYSDEGVIILAGPGLKGDVGDMANRCLEEAKGEIAYADYKYTRTVKRDGKDVALELDLDRLRKALRWGELAVACHWQPGVLRHLGRNEPPAFIREEIRRMDNGKTQFYDQLPECFRQDGGSTGVDTRYGFSDQDMGVSRISGTVFQMKLMTKDPADTSALREFITDTEEYRLTREGRKGTRKGWAGVLTGLLGQSDGNTFLGDSRSNLYFLTPICAAFHALGEEIGQFQPVSGYTTYRTGRLGDSDAGEMAIMLERTAGRFLAPGLKAAVRWVHADDNSMEEVRQKLTLRWMDQDGKNGLLPHADFLLNFLENAKPEIIDEIIQGLRGCIGAGGAPVVDDRDMANIRTISEIFMLRRTVREMSDLDAILKHDTLLDSEIGTTQEKRGEILEWAWSFAGKAGKLIQDSYTEIIEKLSTTHG